MSHGQNVTVDVTIGSKCHCGRSELGRNVQAALVISLPNSSSSLCYYDLSGPDEIIENDNENKCLKLTVHIELLCSDPLPWRGLYQRYIPSGHGPPRGELT